MNIVEHVALHDSIWYVGRLFGILKFPQPDFAKYKHLKILFEKVQLHLLTDIM
jgi:hypothetical protein